MLQRSILTCAWFTLLSFIAAGQSGPTIGLSTTTMSFVFPDPSQPSSQQTVTVTNTGSGANFAVSVAASSAGSWLSVSPTSGTTPLTLTVTASPFQRGVFSGTITITAASGSGVTNSPQTISVSNYTGTPVIGNGGIVNSASYVGGTVTPGSIYSIFGVNLASGIQSGKTIPLPQSLGPQGTATMVWVQDIPPSGPPPPPMLAPLFYASPQQVNFQMPFELTGPSATIGVESGSEGPQVTVNIRGLAPGIFTTNSAGSGQAAALNSDGTPNSPANPASAGSSVSLYVTGLGPTNGPVHSNQPGGAGINVNVAITTPTVMFNQVAANVTFAGLAPGFIGLYQINATIPSSISSGAAQVVVIDPGATSNVATISVK